MSTSFFKRLGKALANKGKAQYYDESKVRLIGFWRSEEDEAKPDPGQFVDPGWDDSEKQEVIEFLKKGEIVAAYRGYSWCRFSCKNNQNGTSDLSDGYYRWPEGLVHYVETHHVKLPEEFIQHIKSQQGHDAERLDRIKSRRDPEYIDSQWWLNQTGNDLPSVMTYRSPSAKRVPISEGYPYSIGCPGPKIHKRKDGRFQITIMAPLGSLVNSTYGTFLKKELADFFQIGFPALQLIPVTIFRKMTGEEWTDYYRVAPTSLPAASHLIFSDEKNHSGNNMWLGENSSIFVTKELKDSLQAAGFNDIAFYHNILR